MTSSQSHGISPATVETIAGLSAGLVSTIIVHPLDIIKTRLQGRLGSPPSLYFPLTVSDQSTHLPILSSIPPGLSCTIFCETRVRLELQPCTVVSLRTLWVILLGGHCTSCGIGRVKMSSAKSEVIHLVISLHLLTTSPLLQVPECCLQF